MSQSGEGHCFQLPLSVQRQHQEVNQKILYLFPTSGSEVANSGCGREKAQEERQVLMQALHSARLEVAVKQASARAPALII